MGVQPHTQTVECCRAARLTHTTVVHVGVVDPALRLFDLPLQVDGGLGRPAVRNRLVGLGLQVLQGSGDLLGQCPGLWRVPLTSEGSDIGKDQPLYKDMDYFKNNNNQNKKRNCSVVHKIETSKIRSTQFKLPYI